MQVQRVETEEAPRAIGPYSQGIVAGEWVFVSGQIGLDPASGALLNGSFGEEVRRALANLGGVLRAAGSDPDQAVRVTAFLTDLADFAEMNAIYEEFFGRSRPARSTVGVASLPRGARVEFDVIALRR